MDRGDNRAYQAVYTIQKQPYLKHRDRSSALGNGQKLHNVAPVVELDIIVATDNHVGKGVILGVQGDGEGGKALHATGTPVIVDLDEVIGIAGLLAGALQMGLAITLIFISFR